MFQTVFLRLIENDRHRLRAWRGPEGFHRYLARIVRTTGADQFRGRGRREVPWEFEQGWDRADDAPDPESAEAARERAAAVRAVLEQLSPADRELFHMHYVRWMSVPEIAAALGKNPNAVHQALHVLHRRLRERLEKQFPELFGEVSHRGAP